MYMGKMCEPRVVKLQDNETIKFIELYASERVLYDSTCKYYKDSDLRLSTAKRINEAKGINGFGPEKSTVTLDAINTTVQSEKMEEAPATPNGKLKTPPEPSPSQRKKKVQDSQINYMCSAIQKLDGISTRAAQIPKEDCYDYFGKYVASMLRNLGPPTAMRLQDQITRLITQAMCPPPNTWSRPPSSNQLSNDSVFLSTYYNYFKAINLFIH
ncbi:hypothetical protein J6590_092741 [Homalodisca vitripennis]|nr:hypothetical protein J6590_092741 [Homalodisca vitripennis]